MLTINPLYYIITLSILLCFACIDQPSEKEEEESSEEIEIDENLSYLDFSKPSDTIKSGERISFSAPVHGSVGEWVEVVLDNDSVIVVVESYIEYYEPLVEGETGGDGGTKTFVYEGIHPGQALLTVNEMFRGSIEDTYSITIVVSE